MAQYSIAATRDNLADLIDQALAGEEVIITRHGKPAVSLTVVADVETPERTQAEWMEWLRERREQLPPLEISAVDLVRQMRDAGAH